MSKGIVCGIDFYEGFSPQDYWSFPSSWDLDKRKSEFHSMLYSDEYVASEKKDGYFERLIKDEDGNVWMCSKKKGVNGWVEKHEWVPHLNSFFESLPNETVLLTEVYRPGMTSKSIVTILGCAKDKAIERQKDDKNKLRMYVYDVLAFNGELLTGHAIEDRVLHQFKDMRERNNFPFVDYAEYWDSPEDIYSNWMRILGEGGEGVVLVKKSYPYTFGKRTARMTLKLKKELQETLDVFLTGRWKEANKLYTGKDIDNWTYWYNEITGEKVRGTLSDFPNIDGFTPTTKNWWNNWAGSIEIAVMREGKVQAIGWISGITEDVREGIVKRPHEYAKKVLELRAMEIDRTEAVPTLRHAKIDKWREDKSYKDCDFSQLL